MFGVGARAPTWVISFPVRASCLLVAECSGSVPGLPRRDTWLVTTTDKRGGGIRTHDLLLPVYVCVKLSTYLYVSCCLALQVFRTYNASITLDKLLLDMEEGGGVGHRGEPYCIRSLEAKKADYDRANKEVRGGGGCSRGKILGVCSARGCWCHQPCSFHTWIRVVLYLCVC